MVFLLLFHSLFVVLKIEKHKKTMKRLPKNYELPENCHITTKYQFWSKEYKLSAII